MWKKFKKLIEFKDIREKRRIIYLLSFLLPFVITIVLLIVKKVFPFGEKCILRTDFYHQYLPFYTELSSKLKRFGSLFYTYDVGLGTNFVTLFAYYLSCPLNILLIFVPIKYVLEFMTIMIVLKIALCGLSMSYYLVKKYKTDSLIVVPFAVLYAFSGYIGAYYWNIMWLDNIALFPLLILGFENAFNGKKPYLFIITLGLSLLCNYYIGTISCLFFVFYFFFYAILREVKPKEFFIKLLHIGVYSIIGVLISAVLLLPVIFAFKTTASSGSTFPKQFREYFTLIEMLGRQLPLTKVENGINYWPNIYSGVICLPLLILYFTSKKYKTKEKICYAVLLLFFYASFAINKLDYIWHLLKFPNSLPCRHSFIYNLLLLSICIKPLLKFNSIKDKEVIFSFTFIFTILMVSHKALETEKVPFYSIYFAIIYLLIYFIIFLKALSKKTNRNLIILIAIVAVSLEASINMYETSIYTITRNDYMKNTDNIRTVVDNLKTKTNDFDRIERAVLRTKDDGAFLNFKTNSIFSSSAYKSGTDFYKQFGMEASTNGYSITGSTPFMDAFFNVKYKIFEKKPENTGKLNMREIDNIEDVYLYQNIDTLPLSFMLENSFLESFDQTSGNPATVQNNVSRTLKLPVMLDKMNIDINGKNAKFKVVEGGDYYAFVRDKGIKEVTVSYNTTSTKFKNLNRGFFIELGYVAENTDLDFRNDTNDSELLIELFKFNFDSMKKVLNNIKDNSTFKLVNYNDTHIEYNINANKTGTCVITLPYDDGFTVKVDGKLVEKETVMNFLLGFKLDRGNHTVTIDYMPVGFKEGLALSILGILLLVGLVILNNKNKKAPIKEVP